MPRTTQRLESCAAEGEIAGLRHRDIENSNEVSLSHDGSACAVVLGKVPVVAVFGGPEYSLQLLHYEHGNLHQPVAPLLTRDGKALATKRSDTVMVLEVLQLQGGIWPVAVSRVRDDSAIPGGPTHGAQRGLPPPRPRHAPQAHVWLQPHKPWYSSTDQFLWE